MTEAKIRVLFSVEEVTEETGEVTMQVIWHPEIRVRLDDISPNYAYTDKLIDLAEEIVQDIREFDAGEDE